MTLPALNLLLFSLFFIPLILLNLSLSLLTPMVTPLIFSSLVPPPLSSQTLITPFFLHPSLIILPFCLLLIFHFQADHLPSPKLFVTPNLFTFLLFLMTFFPHLFSLRPLILFLLILIFSPLLSLFF